MIKPITKEDYNNSWLQIHSIPEAIVSVKDAELLRIGRREDQKKYVVYHYRSIIMEITNNEVITCTKKTQSDNKACRQALKYLDSKLTLKDVKLLLSYNTLF
jgi:hypothetical protein